MTNEPITDLMQNIVGTNDYFKLAFERWLPTCSRLPEFLSNYERKIRKKIREIDDEGKQADLIAELHIAWLLLKKPEFEIEYEPWGKDVAAPDYFVKSTNDRWSIEVKHLRDISQPLDLDSDEAVLPEIPSNESRLRNIVTRSRKQWRNDMPTLLWINTRCGNTDVTELSFALERMSESHTFEELSGAMILSTWESSYFKGRSLLRVNQHAKHPLSAEAINFLLNVEKRDRAY